VPGTTYGLSNNGWIDQSCFRAACGWQTISSSTQLVLAHYCCCWMVTAHTTTQQQFANTHHTSHNLLTHVCLGPWSETGVMCATTSCNKVQVKLWQNTSFPPFLVRPGWRQWFPKISLQDLKSVVTWLLILGEMYCVSFAAHPCPWVPIESFWGQVQRTAP